MLKESHARILGLAQGIQFRDPLPSVFSFNSLGEYSPVFPLLLMQGAVLWYDRASLCQVSAYRAVTCCWYG